MNKTKQKKLCKIKLIAKISFGSKSISHKAENFIHLGSKGAHLTEIILSERKVTWYMARNKNQQFGMWPETLNAAKRFIIN